MGAVHALDGLFAGRIDIRHDHRVRIVETGGELVEQGLQAREAMGLHNRNHLPARGGACGAQHRRDLHGMMAIIIEDHGAVPVARTGEAPLDAAKARKPRAYGLHRHPQLIGHRDGRRGVEGVVMARHGQHDILQIGGARGFPIAHQHIEPAYATRQLHIEQTHIRLGIFAIGDDAPILDAAHQLLHRGMVEAHDGEAIEGQILHQGAEGLLHGVEGLEVIEMLGVDIGDDGDVGGQLQEGAVAFIRLHHHPLALAKAGIGAIGVDDAAIDDRGIKAALVEQGRHHGGGRGLAMGARDGDTLLEAHEFGEHFGAAHHRQAPLARAHQFRIVAADGGGDHDHGGLAEIGGVVPDEDRGALVAQALHIGAVAGVRALHLVTEIEQDLRDAGHADAADADEMNGAKLTREFHAVVSGLRARSMMSITRSARRSAASGTPARLAACARCAKPA